MQAIEVEGNAGETPAPGRPVRRWRSRLGAAGAALAVAVVLLGNTRTDTPKLPGS